MIFIKVTQQTQNICIAFVQRRPNVFDAGPTLYKCYTNVLCLLGIAGLKASTRHLLADQSRVIAPGSRGASSRRTHPRGPVNWALPFTAPHPSITDVWSRLIKHKDWSLVKRRLIPQLDSHWSTLVVLGHVVCYMSSRWLADTAVGPLSSDATINISQCDSSQTVHLGSKILQFAIVWGVYRYYSSLLYNNNNNKYMAMLCQNTQMSPKGQILTYM